MEKYSIIDHPSDTGMATQGKELTQAYENAAYAMMDMMYGLKGVRPLKRISVKVEGDDPQSLLVNWLNEILYIYDSKRIIFCRFKISELSDKILQADIFGQDLDPTVHKAKMYIKAATYNQLEIKKERDAFKLKVIFDI